MTDSIVDMKLPGHENDPPAYSEGVLLYPTTADASSRYSRTYPRVESVEFTIHPGLHAIISLSDGDNDSKERGNFVTLAPLPLPSPWSQHLHPEGATYFVNSLINVVTDSNIAKADVFSRFMDGVGQVQSLAANLCTPISGDVELYMRADEPASCHYYLVNHCTQTEFWLNENELSDLGFSRVVSQTHLKHALEEHYWTHVEYFPHRCIPKKLLRELLSVLRHGQLDHETSRSSTFPFDANQCKRFIKLLSVDEEEAQSPYYTCMAARLWASIAKHRFDNMYGEEFARLDRHTRRRDEIVDHEPFYMKVASTLLFDYSKRITKKLDDLYVDETTYTMHWRKFIRDMYDTWRDLRFVSICLLIVSAILVSNLPGFLAYYIGLAAIACSALSLVSSIIILNKFHEKLEFVAIDAVSYLSEKKHERLGFQPLSLVMAIPKAFTTWSTILFLTQIFSIIVESTGAPLLLSTIIIFGALATVLLLLIVKFLVATVLDIWRRRRRQYGCPV